MYVYIALVEKKKHMPSTPVLQSTLPLGTMKANPIEIDDEISNSDFLDIGMDEITGIAISI